MDKWRYAVFILSYRRADRQKTLKALRDQGYTGEWFIVCSDDDPTIAEYQERYGRGRVLVFNKDEYMDRVDSVDNFGERATVLYARNAVYDLAEGLGYEFFFQSDDDHEAFSYRYEEGGSLKAVRIEKLQEVLDEIVAYYAKSRIQTLSFGMVFDYIGGVNSRNWLKRLPDHGNGLFLGAVSRGHNFRSSYNEDQVHSQLAGREGKLVKTLVDIQLITEELGANDGGMKGVYSGMGDSVEYLGKMRELIVNPAGKVIRVGVGHFRLDGVRDCLRPMIVAEKVI